MPDYRLKGEATDLSLNSSWEGGSAPSSATDARIIIGESGPPVTDGLSESLNVNEIVRLPGVRKRIGGNGTSWDIDVNNGTAPRIIDRGGGGEAHAMYIDGTVPEFDALGSALIFTGGQAAATLGVIGPGAYVQVGGSCAFGASAGAGLVHNNGGTLDVRAHGTDRLGEYIGLNRSFLSTRRNVEAATLAGPGRVSLFESATVTDGSSGGEIKVLDPGAVLALVNNQDVTIDSLEAIAGVLDAGRLQGALTISAGNLNRSGFRMPSSLVGGDIDVSGMTVYGSDTPMDSI